MTRPRRVRGIVGAGLIALTAVLTGCQMAPSATVTTTMPGVSERMFALDWNAEPDSRGGRKIEGHVENRSDFDVRQVQLLVQALDPSGGVVSQRRQWVGGTIVVGSRRYFEMRDLPPAGQYRVSVWSYDVIQRPGDGFDVCC